MKLFGKFAVILILGLVAVTATVAQSELAPGSAQLINPEDLVNILQAAQGREATDPERRSFSSVYAGAHSRLGVHRAGLGFTGN